MNNKLYKQITGKCTFLVACFLVFSGCNKEWEGEQYEKYLSFVNTGVNKVYLKYEDSGGKKKYILPVQVSGSEMPDSNINVSIMLDKDTIGEYNYEIYRNREDLYFKELDDKHYNLESWSTVIPAGESQGYIEVDFSLAGINNYYNYILPLQIDPESDLPRNPKKHYKKSLVQIVPFNDYSGTYTVTGDLYLVQERDSEGKRIDDKSDLIDLLNRKSFVYDENTIFMYAGLVDEEALDRKEYLIYIRFNSSESEESGTITMWCDNEQAIGFDYDPAQCSYTIYEEMHTDYPYILRKFVAINLQYWFKDITNPDYPLDFEFEGMMTMERQLHILKPEEDQIIW